MIADYHIHTHLCKHADGTPAEYISQAMNRGIQEICFTDHAPTNDGYDPDNRMALSQFNEYRDLIKANTSNTPTISILYGIEADYYSGCEAFLEPWLKQNDFDLVIGSIHYIDFWGFDNPREKTTWDSVNITETWAAYFDLLSRMAETGLYDVVGHLDLPKKFNYRPGDSELTQIAAHALDSIADAGMTIEINTSGLRKPVQEIYPSLLILDLAHKRNIPICFGSDSHTPATVGQDFDKAVSLAKLAGYSESVRFSKRKKTPVTLP